MSIHGIVINSFDVDSNSGLPSVTPMLRRPSTRLTVFLFALALATPASRAFPQKNHVHHERKHLEREQIVALEGSWRVAALGEDVTAMDKLLSDDYIGISSSGEVLTKAQQLDHMRDRQLILTKLDTSDFKIKLIGNVAIVTSLAQVQGTSDGQPLQGAFRYTHVFQRLPSGIWKITNFEVTPTTRLHALRASQN
jgi:ketosteroid isomerase-like protein